MRFTDTRNRSVSVSFQQAIFTGLAESGGLYYADKNPDLSQLFDSFTPQTSFNEIASRRHLLTKSQRQPPMPFSAMN